MRAPGSTRTVSGGGHDATAGGAVLAKVVCRDHGSTAPADQSAWTRRRTTDDDLSGDQPSGATVGAAHASR